jgi:hypothetical protein
MAGLVTVKKDKEAEFTRQNRPIYLGTLIYSYARDHMYRSVIANYDIIYQDTDSALMTMAEYDRFAAERPELLGNNFGQFAMEEGSELFDSYITLSPKNYFIMGNKPKHTLTKAIDPFTGKSYLDPVTFQKVMDKTTTFEYGVVKKGFKGVALDNDKLIRNPADYFKEIASTTSKGVTYYDVNRQKGFNLYYGDIDYTVENAARANSGLQPIVTPKCVREDWLQFMEGIKSPAGCSYVLCSNIQKLTRNVAASNQEAGCMYQRFILKKIKVDTTRTWTAHVDPTDDVYYRLIETGYEDHPEPVPEVEVEAPPVEPEIVSEIPAVPCTFKIAAVGGTVLPLPEAKLETIEKMTIRPGWEAGFDEVNNLRLDLGGNFGNRAFHVPCDKPEIHAEFVNGLMTDMGANFNLNEYVGKSGIDTKLFIDIDERLTSEMVKRIIKVCDEAIGIYEMPADPDGWCEPPQVSPNKYLQSTNGKFHIVMDIGRGQPVHEVEELDVVIKSTHRINKEFRLTRAQLALTAAEEGLTEPENNLAIQEELQSRGLGDKDEYINAKRAVKEANRELRRAFKEERKAQIADGKLRDLNPTHIKRKSGEVSYDDSKQGRRAVLDYFKHIILAAIGPSMTKAYFDKVFDTNAQGLRPAYSIKVQGGICKSRHYYRKLGSTAVTQAEKAAEIVECSIYGWSRSELTDEAVDAIAKIRHHNEVHAAAEQVHKEKKSARKLSKYQYNGASVTVRGIGEIEANTSLIGAIVGKLPDKAANGSMWKKVIRPLAMIATPDFEENYLLHIWSKKGWGYNREGNDKYWQELRKTTWPVEDKAKAYAWLMDFVGY